MRLVPVLFVAAMLGWFSVSFALGQPNGPKWTFEVCSTNACVQAQLNALSAQQAAVAKLTTWQHVTYVWYPER